MLRRGELASRSDRPSLSLDQVTSLRDERAEAAVQRERRRQDPPSSVRPPDEDHEWLMPEEAAAVLGTTVVALNARARRGRVPSVLHRRKRWYRLDHLEMWLRASTARRTGRLVSMRDRSGST